MKVTDGFFNCEYCGQRAWERDHVIPLAVAFSGKRKKGHRGVGLTVPCCRECNSLLGHRPILTVQKRAAFLVNAYRNHYQTLLGMPEWTDEELDNLQSGLRQSILHAAKEQFALKSRIAHLLLVSARQEKERP